MHDLKADDTQDGVRFNVKVAPRAAREAVIGVHAGALKVSLRAAPVDGAANAALCELLATVCGVPKRAVSIRRGEHARTKTIYIEGLSAAGLRAAVQAHQTAGSPKSPGASGTVDH